MRRQLLVALALIAGIFFPAISAPLASADAPAKAVAGIGIRLVDVPTATADDPRARAYIIDHLKPGKTIERRIEVTNGTASRASVSVYPAAANVTGGGFVGAAGHTQNDLASWMSATPRSLPLAPQQRSFVTVTIRVPALAVRGERYGVVWAEISSRPETPGGITQVSRVGIRLYLSVGPGGAPISDFDIVSLTAIRDTNNIPVVQASISNTGERALDLTGSLTLSQGPAGLSAGPFPIPAGTTLGIHARAAVLVPLDKQLPNGPWLAKITVTSGVTQRTAQATLTFPAEPGAGPAVAPDKGWKLPWWGAGVAIAAGLVLLLIAGRYLLRRRRPQAGARSRA